MENNHPISMIVGVLTFLLSALALVLSARQTGYYADLKKWLLWMGGFLLLAICLFSFYRWWEADREEDLMAWQSADKCGAEQCLKAYLEDYPKGRYAKQARARLTRERPQPSTPAVALDPQKVKQLATEAAQDALRRAKEEKAADLEEERAKLRAAEEEAKKAKHLETQRAAELEEEREKLRAAQKEESEKTKRLEADQASALQQEQQKRQQAEAALRESQEQIARQNAVDLRLAAAKKLLEARKIAAARRALEDAETFDQEGATAAFRQEHTTLMQAAALQFLERGQYKLAKRVADDLSQWDPQSPEYQTLQAQLNSR